MTKLVIGTFAGRFIATFDARIGSFATTERK
jgi:hypothetical protein